eukprot:COSAG06_NODE_2832_length_6205_cov_6.623485_2_plen_95_part_00
MHRGSPAQAGIQHKAFRSRPGAARTRCAAETPATAHSDASRRSCCVAVGAWRSEGGRGRPRTAGGVVIQAGVSQGGWFALHRLFLRTSRLKGQL